uniref:Putative snf2 family dna-dependent atpase n=1 Tax=Lutzomyia longipalpis TaxID=7200 RepID=A0A7G3AY70_LUTLO
MNEADSAGGPRGRSSAPPAAADRRSLNLTAGPAVRVSGGSALINPQQMSRLATDNRVLLMSSSSSPTGRNQQQQQQAVVQQTSNQPPSGGNLIFISTASGDLSTGNLINSISSSSSSGGVVIQRAPEVTAGVVSLGNVTLAAASTCIVSSTALASVQEGTIVTSSSGDLHNLLRKRPKLEDRDNSIAAIKKRILEHKYSRLRSLKDKHTEHVAELFFLQASGNMMDYPTWRKKPQTPELINFAKTWRLDQASSASDDTAAKLLQNCGQSYGTEIKIPGVGATPVAVSTTLPSAVVQLTQQGGTPLVPDTVETPDKKPPLLSTSSSSLTTPATPLTPTPSTPASSSGGGTQEQFSVKAKQEVYVMQRISELQREGLWAEKRLPKLQEPSRPKAHWDYLLEEMVWLSADFAQERKWKKAAAKKCARMVQKYFQDKAMAAQRAERAQEAQLKRIAAFVAKEIKVFWSNVEKLVEYKQQTKLEEKRKKALDQHLSFIVDQTEKFSQQLAEGMNKSVVDGSAAPSLNSSRISSPKRTAQSDDEFSPGNESSDDDEETIAKAEAEATCVNEEILALQRESEMDFDDFLKELPKDYLKNRDNIVLPDIDEDVTERVDDSADEEFKATASSTDDEESIMEQESKEKNKDHKKEIAELEADNEMSIEDLMAKYKNLPKVEKMEIDSEASDDSSNGGMDEDDEESEEEEQESDEEEDETDDGQKDDGPSLQNLFNEESGGNKDQLIDDAAAIAESLQPKGNTLSSTNVVTEVPFLLKHTLREYQHIGLDWLVTMHDRKLNGILADEMGLGKTIQTISLLAHLACCKGNWGPHLIIVPSSVMLNWEMEFKKWCPGFKILTYYGNQKERKAKRIGWTKANAFHICITSYKLVIQDHQSFRRKKWKYLILDEAQNIKNFKSQRWQLLLNFQTEQRLLLTGTPLQNNLMELWSLMHFLMPHVFQSHKEFKEWFSNPMTGMIEGNSEYNDSIIKRLHKVLRPFLLRRLKCEVEKQMPKKYEHVVMCRLSKRQRYLYDDFMSRAKTRETLASGNLLSVINVLMQLRKVCNHPNLFEVRPTISPFRMDGIKYWTASLACNLFDYNPLEQIDLHSLNLVLINLELSLTAYVAHRSKQLSTPRKLIEEIDTAPELPPRCPTGRFRLHVKVRDERVQEALCENLVKVGTSPAMRAEGSKFVPIPKFLAIAKNSSSSAKMDTSEAIAQIVHTAASGGEGVAMTQIGGVQTSTVVVNSGAINVRRKQELSKVIGENTGMIVQTSNGRHILIPTSSTAGTATTVLTQNGQRLTVVSKNVGQMNKIAQHVIAKPLMMKPQSGHTQPLAAAVAHHLKYRTTSQYSGRQYSAVEVPESEFLVAETEESRRERRLNQLRLLGRTNRRRVDATPVYGEDLRQSIVDLNAAPVKNVLPWTCRGYETCRNIMLHPKREVETSLGDAIKTYEERTRALSSIFSNFVTFVPNVSAPMPTLHVSHPPPSKLNEENDRQTTLQEELSSKLVLLHPIISAMSTQFPDPRLIQYDCGKLQTLNVLLRKLKTDGHRVLIFTQMTRMLDVLEAFLNYHGHIYLRLDGTTRIEQRQILMERFNGDKRIFVFILSTRSGGVGINLTGADTVIFYDSDWNPTMDAQAQDRCHRIGQTRDVHIYRLVSEKTIEENILKKANQKRLLGDLAIEGGNFTTAFFKTSTIQDLFNVDTTTGDASSRFQELIDRDKERKQRLYESIAGPSVVPADDKQSVGAFETALAAAEDEQDVQAAKTATAEAAADLAEFDENIPLEDVAERTPEISKADQEVENLMKQLSPIERYAMRFVEETGGAWTAEQLKAAEAEIEQQKREWEANRQAALLKEEEELKQAEEEDIMLTYSSEDAKNQVKNNNMMLKRKKNKKSGSRNSTGRENCKRVVSSEVSSSSSKKVVMTARRKDERKDVSMGKRMVVMGGKKMRNLQQQKKKNVIVRNSAKEGQVKGDGVKTKKKKVPMVNLRQKISKAQRAKIESRLRPRVSLMRCDVQENSVSSVNDATSSGTSNNRSDEDDFDSECSLDVMVDSNDAAASTDSNVNRNDNDTASLNSVATSESSSSVGGSSKNSEDRKLSTYLPQNHVDVNSPRTRSRGAVKINLWTLDVSPILPKIQKPMRNSTGRLVKATAAADSPTHEDHEVENVNGNVVRNNRRANSLTPTNRVQTAVKGAPAKPSAGVSKRKAVLETSGKMGATLDGWVTKIPRIVGHEGATAAAANQEAAEVPKKATPPPPPPPPPIRMTRRQSIWISDKTGDAMPIWISDKTGDAMPMWCPPTPPQDENDLYMDFSLGYLYEIETMAESQLPPVYVKKEFKRNRTEAGLYGDNRRPVKVRKEDTYYPPRSLFDRPSPALAKMRRDLKLQKYRGIFKPTLHMAAVKHQMAPVKPLVEPEGMIEWFIYEDMAMLNVIQNLQGFNLSLVLVSPGHTPNWDLVADIVNQTSRTYRSPKQCRYRYEAVIVPREEGKLQESPKKQKKNKHPPKGSLKNSRSMRTSQLYASDNNSTFTKLMRQKFDNIKQVMVKKTPQLKQVLVNPTMKNPKHAALLAEYGITNYDNPPTPMEIAQRRVDRIAKEKQKNMPVSQAAQLPELAATTAQQMAAQRHEITVPAVLQQPQTIVVQQQSPTVLQTTGVTPVAALVQSSSPLQTIRAVQSAVGISQQQSPQIVKAIVASGQNIIATPVQQIAVAQAQSTQSGVQGQPGVVGAQGAQQTTQQTVVVPSSVSVVLTTPVTTISSGQTTQQIVSIQQASVASSVSTGQTASGGTLVQTISTSPQVMSVGQLPTVGTVIATTAIPPNATVATLTTSALRAQRIVPANLQEVVLHQRGGSQSPTVVSVSGLGQGLTPAQLQAAQFRLSMAAAAAAGGQHVVAAAKGIPLGSVTTSPVSKATTSSHQIQFYRQQSIRQQLKVLHTAPASGTPGQQQSGTAAAVVQTAGGQTTLVSPAGAIIQGGIVQTTGNIAQAVQVQQGAGQKVAVATVSAAGGAVAASGVVTNVATVQVAPAQQTRTQFIKQVGGKQTTIARQVTDNEMQAIMMKRQIINQQHKGLPQTQIFAPTSVQMQQATSSATVGTAVGTQPATVAQQTQQQPQQIATLVKTSTGTVAAAGTPGMTFSQVKPNQLKATAIASPGQTRPLQIQQQIAITPQRKPKVAQITQVAGKTGVQTQLIVQNPKGLPVTMQQLFRQGQQGIVLSKSRVIPVSMASQPNNRQTIQTLRTHVTPGNLTGTLQGAIKVAAAAGATQAQQQQALITAFQNQQNQRQNVSPVRLQTSSGGSLVALAVQQAPQIVTQSTSGAGNIVEVAASGSSGGSGQPQQQQQPQQTQQQQQQQNPHHSQVGGRKHTF